MLRPTTLLRRFSTRALDSKLLTIERTTTPIAKRAKEELKFGVDNTDHMLEIEWDHEGAQAPRIVPHASMAIHPSASGLHYGLECFEGMKAFLDDNNKIRLFRPDMNLKRFNSSLERLVMPTFDEAEYLVCLKELLKLDKDWIPAGRGYSLYIRPTAVSTLPALGVVVSSLMKSFVVCSPVGPYFPTGMKAVKLLADPSFVRAWPGGVGAIKCGGNYAMGMQAMVKAQASGSSQVLWLFGENHQVTEAGTMNVMFLWTTPDGGKELVTAPLDGTILPGVTRDSILHLARSYGEFEVSERIYTMSEVKAAVDEGRMIEAFGCGTAAIVCPIKTIDYQGEDLHIPCALGEIGQTTDRLLQDLMDIQYGTKEMEDWSVVVD